MNLVFLVNSSIEQSFRFIPSKRVSEALEYIPGMIEGFTSTQSIRDYIMKIIRSETLDDSAKQHNLLVNNYRDYLASLPDVIVYGDLVPVPKIVNHINICELAIILGLEECIDALEDWFASIDKSSTYQTEVLSKNYSISFLGAAVNGHADVVLKTGRLLNELYAENADGIFKCAFAYALSKQQTYVLMAMLDEFCSREYTATAYNSALVGSYKDNFLAGHMEFCASLLELDSPVLLAFVARNDAYRQEFLDMYIPGKLKCLENQQAKLVDVNRKTRNQLFRPYLQLSAQSAWIYYIVARFLITLGGKQAEIRDDFLEKLKLIFNAFPVRKLLGGSAKEYDQRFLFIEEKAEDTARYSTNTNELLFLALQYEWSELADFLIKVPEVRAAILSSGCYLQKENAVNFDMIRGYLEADEVFAEYLDDAAVKSPQTSMHN